MNSNHSAMLSEIQRSLGRLEGKIESFHEAFVKHDAEDKKLYARTVANEARIQKLERGQSHTRGRLAAFGTMAGVAAAGAFELVRKLWS